MTATIRQADVDLAKLVRRAADKLGESVEPHVQALADAEPMVADPDPINVPVPFVPPDSAGEVSARTYSDSIDTSASTLCSIPTLRPSGYSEARSIDEVLLQYGVVMINLTATSDSDAKRLLDFAAGLCFGRGGHIVRVTNRVFLLSWPRPSSVAADSAGVAENSSGEPAPTATTGSSAAGSP